MIDKIKKVAEIWKALPIVPRRVVLFTLLGSFIIYVSLRVMWVAQNLERLDELSFWRFIGF